MCKTRVKIISRRDTSALESVTNSFLEKIKGSVIDIKYTINDSIMTAMIIYEKTPEN